MTEVKLDLRNQANKGCGFVGLGLGSGVLLDARARRQMLRLLPS